MSISSIILKNNFYIISIFKMPKSNFPLLKDFINKIISGDREARKNFLKEYSPIIMDCIYFKACNKFCKINNEGSDCQVKYFTSKPKKIPSKFEKESCDDGIDIYKFSCEQIISNDLKNYKYDRTLIKYIKDKTSYNIIPDYFRNKYGRITIPKALESLTEKEKKIFKLICQKNNLEDVAKSANERGIFDNDNIDPVKKTKDIFEKIKKLLEKNAQEKNYNKLTEKQKTIFDLEQNILKRDKNISNEILIKNISERIKKDIFYVKSEFIFIKDKMRLNEDVWYILLGRMAENTQSQSINITNDDETNDIDIRFDEEEYEHKELRERMTTILNEFYKENPSVYRILKLYLLENKSGKNIFEEYGDLFQFQNEAQVSNLISRAIESIVKKLRNEYEINISGRVSGVSDCLSYFLNIFEDLLANKKGE